MIWSKGGGNPVSWAIPGSEKSRKPNLSRASIPKVQVSNKDDVRQKQTTVLEKTIERAKASTSQTNRSKNTSKTADTSQTHTSFGHSRSSAVCLKQCEYHQNHCRSFEHVSAGIQIWSSLRNGMDQWTTKATR